MKWFLWVLLLLFVLLLFHTAIGSPLIYANLSDDNLALMNSVLIIPPLIDATPKGMQVLALPMLVFGAALLYFLFPARKDRLAKKS